MNMQSIVANLHTIGISLLLTSSKDIAVHTLPLRTQLQNGFDEVRAYSYVIMVVVW